MKNEIERKFFVKQMPDLSEIKPFNYERYFLESKNGKEVRISKVNNKYFYEEKSELSDLERTREKKEITQEEFGRLKQDASEGLIRDKYVISDNPNTVIQVYHGRFEGLIRVEVEFDSEEQAKSFIPPSWIGEEMTGSPIARDSSLVNLSDEEFKKYLKTWSARDPSLW